MDRPKIASIKIDGKWIINNIKIDSNVMTSAYRRNNYDNFMQRNIGKGNLLYDIDKGIIKRIVQNRSTSANAFSTSLDNSSKGAVLDKTSLSIVADK